MDLSFTLRPALPGDEPFLYSLYCSTRAEEVAAWGWPDAQRDVFLRMQFNAQQLQYGHYQGGEHHLVLVDGAPVGRRLVARTEEEVRLVDVALLPERRGAGLGAALVRELQAEAARAGRPLRLQVLKANRASRLYERLGFTRAGDDGVYLRMEWRAKG